MSTKPELLPCPWCGRELDKVEVIETSTFRWRAVKGCCTNGPEIRHDTIADDQEAANAESRQRAINAWNTRAPSPMEAATDVLRELLAERQHRTEGDLLTLANRCLHFSRGDRDLLSLRRSIIGKLDARIANIEAYIDAQSKDRS